MANSPLFTLLFICCLCLILVVEATNITTTKFLRDSETIVSTNGYFKLGFFSPTTNNSSNRYVGIWYNTRDNFDTFDVLWVANKNNPMNDSNGVLKISSDGNLQLLNELTNSVIWSSNVSDHEANNTTVAQLQDTGNLVLLSNDTGLSLWQSFEDLTNSFLPNMRISIPKGKQQRFEISILRSWTSSSNPSDGQFRVTSNPNSSIPEFMTWKGDKPYWRSGPWNGNLFLGVPYITSRASYNFRFENNDQQNRIEMLYYVANRSYLSNYHLNHDGKVAHRVWDDGSRKWNISWQSIQSECDTHGKCGPFGNCNPKDPHQICNCIKGFVPKNVDEWSQGNWTSGCIRKTSLQCNDSSGSTGGKGDDFLKLSHVKVPDYADYVLTANEHECKNKCIQNCSCLAYAYPHGIGCMKWNNGLIDLQQLPADGADLFIRLDQSELLDHQKRNLKLLIIIVIAIVATIAIVFAFYVWRWMCRRRSDQLGKADTKSSKKKFSIGTELDEVEFKDLVMFKFNEMEVATNNFSIENKLGEGGFGPVYKGKMEDGLEIAVKRLSRASGQGLQEFMNEVLMISKLQHNNLVRLLGCCVEEEEKLLVYEYMSNGSLDALLFDPNHQQKLDWINRFNIINGICRGLLYLHRDSRMKIIHRDLKASNILLDEQLTPKISDFGMARIFEPKQDQATTLRVVGTYGYMSPEYAMEGLFSGKSDVFSLGVLLLEIVSGRKNIGFRHHDSLSLLTYAWKLWNEKNMSSLIDPTVFEPRFEGEILKCIQLGLLCVQELPEDRPSISTLINMLDAKDTMDLPQPKQPGFTLRNIVSSSIEGTQSHEQGDGFTNNMSLTIISGR